MDIPETRLVIQDKDSVNLSRSEYDELKEARLAIDIIGKSLGKYGVNDTITEALLARFGYYFYQEDKNAE